MTVAALGGTFVGVTLAGVTLAGRTFVGGTFVRGPFAGMALAALALTTLAAAFATRLAAAAPTVTAMLALAALPARMLAFLGGVGVNFEVALGARNVLADQLFDRGHRFRIERGDDGDCGTGAAGAAGAADTMHVVVGMMRHVEIEDVADG